MELTVVPLGLVVLGQLCGQAASAAMRLLHVVAPGGAANAAIIPRTPLQFGLVILACVVAAGLGEEFIFRVYLPAALGAYLPRWPARSPPYLSSA